MIQAPREKLRKTASIRKPATPSGRITLRRGAIERRAEQVEHRHDEERTEHVRVLEGAAGAAEAREQLVGARQQAEVADDAGGGGDERGNRPAP